MSMLDPKLETEFNHQVQNLLQKDYPKLAGINETEFLKLVEPLKEKLNNIDLPTVDVETGTLPFVIVIKSDLIPAEKMMSAVNRQEKNGVTKLFPHQSTDFQTISDVSLPKENAYILVGIDRGKESINVRPEDALKTIKSQNRSPLTIDEGIALVTQFPDFLIKNNCFSLLASRHSGDKRVPAIWINAKKEPNLGWCWDGNPHTWLGSASAENRI